MRTIHRIKILVFCLISFSCILLYSCTESEIPDSSENEAGKFESIDEGSGVYIETRSHENSGFATARGIIPDGEYAGQRFHIRIRGEYSGVGTETLISGQADIRIGSDRFRSVEDPALMSFCCGEGGLTDDGGFQTFYMTGQVQHTTEVGTHNHLFGASATSDGEFNFNILDQSGTVVVPADPPHNPEIGEIFEIPAQVVRIHVD